MYAGKQNASNAAATKGAPTPCIALYTTGSAVRLCLRKADAGCSTVSFQPMQLATVNAETHFLHTHALECKVANASPQNTTLPALPSYQCRADGQSQPVYRIFPMAALG